MMDCTVDQIISQISKPFLYVDYNEMLDTNIIMLSQSDTKKDYLGNPVKLYEGLEVVGYQEDEDISGLRDDIVVEGICTRNQTGLFQHVKWVLRANSKGIRFVSNILATGW